METLRSIIENRVNSLKVTEPVVQTVGSNEILVQVPGATDPSQVESLVGQTGSLAFVLLPKASTATRRPLRRLRFLPWERRWIRPC